MREVLDKNGERKKKEKRRKEKRKITDHLIGQKRRKICALCRSVFGEAGSKFQPLDAL